MHCSWQGVRDTTLSEKFVSDLQQVSGSPVSSTNKTDLQSGIHIHIHHHDLNSLMKSVTLTFVKDIPTLFRTHPLVVSYNNT
jgi:hypothetical protein